MRICEVRTSCGLGGPARFAANRYGSQVTGIDRTTSVPGATTAGLSSVADSDCYESALQKAGFNGLAERNRRNFALAFFADLRAKTAPADGPPPLELIARKR
jgi:hypothetical protein